MRTLNFEGQAAIGSFNDHKLKYLTVRFLNRFLSYIFIEASPISTK